MRPPHTTVAPPPAASLTDSSTRSTSVRRISGPTSVSGKSDHRRKFPGEPSQAFGDPLNNGSMRKNALHRNAHLARVVEAALGKFGERCVQNPASAATITGAAPPCSSAQRVPGASPASAAASQLARCR